MNSSFNEASPYSSPSKTNRSRLEVTDDELYIRMVKLEKEVKLKDDQIEQLSHEKKALEKIARKQEEGLLQLTNELSAAKEDTVHLRHELSKKIEDSKDLLAQQKEMFESSIRNQTQMIGSIKEENKKRGKEVISTELYYHVMRLDNELRDRDRIISQLTDENKTLEKLLKATEEDLVKVHAPEQSHDDFNNEQKIIMLENRVRELMSTIVELQQENKMLLTIQNAKTAAIQQLTEELSHRGATEEYVEGLKKEIIYKEQQVKEAKEEIGHLLKLAEEREEALSKFKQQESGIPFHLWHEERRLLQTELRNMQEQKITSEQKIKKLKERVQILTDRINLITKTLGKTGSPIKNTTLRSSVPSTPKSPSARRKSGHSPTSSPSTPLFHSQEAGSEDEEDPVPGTLYKALEHSVRKLNSALESKESALTERGEVIEVLEKKVDVLTRARQADLKHFKKREQELQDQVKALKGRMDFMEEEHREREQEWKSNIISLKNKLQHTQSVK